MWAAANNPNSKVITALIKACADAKIKDDDGRTALDYDRENEDLENRDAYWELNDATYN